MEVTPGEGDGRDYKEIINVRIELEHDRTIVVSSLGLVVLRNATIEQDMKWEDMK
jgi:hypothetical protein